VPLCPCSFRLSHRLQPITCHLLLVGAHYIHNGADHEHKQEQQPPLSLPRTSTLMPCSSSGSSLRTNRQEARTTTARLLLEQQSILQRPETSTIMNPILIRHIVLSAGRKFLHRVTVVGAAHSVVCTDSVHEFR